MGSQEIRVNKSTFTLAIGLAGGTVAGLIGVVPFWAGFVEKALGLEMWAFSWWAAFCGMPLLLTGLVGVLIGAFYMGWHRFTIPGLLITLIIVFWPALPIALYFVGKSKGVEVSILEEGGNYLCLFPIGLVWLGGLIFLKTFTEGGGRASSTAPRKAGQAATFRSTRPPQSFDDKSEHRHSRRSSGLCPHCSNPTHAEEEGDNRFETCDKCGWSRVVSR